MINRTLSIAFTGFLWFSPIFRGGALACRTRFEVPTILFLNLYQAVRPIHKISAKNYPLPCGLISIHVWSLEYSKIIGYKLFVNITFVKWSQMNLNFEISTSLIKNYLYAFWVDKNKITMLGRFHDLKEQSLNHIMIWNIAWIIYWIPYIGTR